MKILLYCKDKFSLDQKKHLSLMENDDEFVSAIISGRQKCNIPDGGFRGIITDNPNQLKVDASEREKLENVEFSILARTSFLICEAYELPLPWLSTINSIMLFGIATPPSDNQEISPIELKFYGLLSKSDFVPKYDETERVGDSKPHLTIIVREGARGKNRFAILIKLLKKHQKEIEGYLELLPNEPKVKTRDLEIKTEIMELKKQGLSSKDISEQIKQDFGENQIPFEPDEQTIRKYRGRLQKIVDGLGSKYKTAILGMIHSD